MHYYYIHQLNPHILYVHTFFKLLACLDCVHIFMYSFIHCVIYHLFIHFLLSCSRGIVPGSFSGSWLPCSRTICPLGSWWPLPPAWYVATLRGLSPESPPSTGTRITTTKLSWASTAAGHRATIHMTIARVSRPNTCAHCVLLMSLCRILVMWSKIKHYFLPSLRATNVSIQLVYTLWIILKPQNGHKIVDLTWHIFFIHLGAPAAFCNDMMRELESNPVTRIVWNSVKPMLMGKILYAPDSPAVRQIIQNVSSN